AERAVGGGNAFAAESGGGLGRRRRQRGGGAGALFERGNDPPPLRSGGRSRVAVRSWRGALGGGAAGATAFGRLARRRRRVERHRDPRTGAHRFDRDKERRQRSRAGERGGAIRSALRVAPLSRGRLRTPQRGRSSGRSRTALVARRSRCRG